MKGGPGDSRHAGRGRFTGKHKPALHMLLGPGELVGGDRFALDLLQFVADHFTGLLDVVFTGSDIGRDDPAVGELFGVGTDRVGQPPLLADLDEQP